MNGMITIGPGTNCFTYTPNTDFVGTETICTYVCDTLGLCDTAYTVITVIPVNDTPTIMQPPVVLPEDSTYQICPTVDDIDDVQVTDLTELKVYQYNELITKLNKYYPDYNINKLEGKFI